MPLSWVTLFFNHFDQLTVTKYFWFTMALFLKIKITRTTNKSIYIYIFISLNIIKNVQKKQGL